MLEVPTIATPREGAPLTVQPACVTADGDDTRPSRLLTAFGTLVVAVLCVSMVLAATSTLQNRAAAIPLPHSAPPLPVQTQTVELVDSFTVPRKFVGQVEAAQTTKIAFELPGKVLGLPVDEATVVNKGDVLARLDTRILENRRATQLAVRKALEARVELSTLTMNRRATLNKKGFMANQLLDQARLGLAELQAMIAEADTAITGIDIEIEKSTIRAPFDGEIADRFIDVGTTVSMGQPVMTVLQRVAPQMRVGLSDEMADRLSIGDQVTARIGSQNYDAVLAQLRADVDPRTRTRTAIFELKLGDGSAAPLYGQTGTVTLSQTIRQSGAWLPVSALQEGARGLWTILTVRPVDNTDHGTVATEAVEILYADEKRAFVRGTFPASARFIPAGPHRITSGQTVRVADKAS